MKINSLQDFINTCKIKWERKIKYGDVNFWDGLTTVASVLCIKYIKRTQNAEIVFIIPEASSPKLVSGFRLNSVFMSVINVV
jgi:hypothetical protein